MPIPVEVPIPTKGLGLMPTPGLELIPTFGLLLIPVISGLRSTTSDETLPAPFVVSALLAFLTTSRDHFFASLWEPLVRLTALATAFLRLSKDTIPKQC